MRKKRWEDPSTKQYWYNTYRCRLLKVNYYHVFINFLITETIFYEVMSNEFKRIMICTQSLSKCIANFHKRLTCKLSWSTNKSIDTGKENSTCHYLSTQGGMNTHDTKMKSYGFKGLQTRNTKGKDAVDHPRWWKRRHSLPLSLAKNVEHSNITSWHSLSSLWQE